MTVIFTVSNVNNLILDESILQQERELITLQALICQLDVATERFRFKKEIRYQISFFSSLDVQQNGLNFIYDMQNCSASQFDVNLSKKILNLLQVILLLCCYFIY